MMKKVLHRASSVDRALVKDDGPVGDYGELTKLSR